MRDIDEILRMTGTELRAYKRQLLREKLTQLEVAQNNLREAELLERDIPEMQAELLRCEESYFRLHDLITREGAE